MRMLAGALVFMWFCLPCQADQLLFLRHGEQSLAEFITQLNAAQKSIDIANFIFQPCDAATQNLLAILETKARAGVTIRVLIDASTQPQPQKSNVVNYFASLGIPFRFYNDFVVIEPTMNLRMHAKFTIIDGATYIAGGRNLSDDYFDISSLEDWIDSDVMVTGAATTQAVTSYNELWNSAMVTQETGLASAYEPWPQFCKMTMDRANQVQNYFAQNSAAIISQIPVRNCTDVKFLTDNPEFGNPEYDGYPASDSDPYMSSERLKMKRASNQILHFLKGTKSTLHAVNWSFMTIGLLNDAMARLSQKGIHVGIVTNLDFDGTPDFVRQAEEYATNQFSTRYSSGSAMVRQVSSREAMTDINPLTPPGTPFMIHAKTMTRDSADAIVSSFNLDARSYDTNVEAVTVVKGCPDFAGDVDGWYQSLSQLYDTDAANNALPPMEQPSGLAIFTAMFSLSLL